MKVTGEICVELQITSPDIPGYASPTTPASLDSPQKPTQPPIQDYPNEPFASQPPRGSPPAPTSASKAFLLHPGLLTPFQDLKGNKLPPGWERRTMINGQTYYVNHNNRSTVWDWEAATDIDGTPLPGGWERRVTAEGRTFYADHNAKKNTWISPNKK